MLERYPALKIPVYFILVAFFGSLSGLSFAYGLNVFMSFLFHYIP